MTFPQTGGADAPGGSSAPPSHRRVRGGRSWAQRLIITSGVLLAAITLVAAVLVGVLWFKLNRFERVDLDLADKPPAGPVNFLMVGSDSRDGISEDDPDAGAFLGEAVSGQRTDTIMVVRVDAAANTISIL
jgi:anionic cell wall polymer biosynthesis LytR-Cps2A-Psr (LCP) family protein